MKIAASAYPMTMPRTATSSPTASRPAHSTGATGQATPGRYDLTHINQDEINRLGRELLDRGQMSELDMAVMTLQLPRAISNADGSLKDMRPPVDDGTRRDLLGEYRARIEFDESHGQDSSVLRRILAVLEGVQAGGLRVDLQA